MTTRPHKITHDNDSRPQFDHHCIIVGSCIARGNMPFFVSFLTVASTLCLAGAFMMLPFFVMLWFAKPLDRLPPTVWTMADVRDLLPAIVGIPMLTWGSYTVMLAAQYHLVNAPTRSTRSTQAKTKTVYSAWRIFESDAAGVSGLSG